MTEPNKESVRIAFPSRPDKTPPAASAAKHDTVRIVLPSRTPVAPLRRVPPRITPLPASDSAVEPPAIFPRRPPAMPPQSVAVSPLLQPLPKPPGPETSAESRAATTPPPAGSIQAGPKNETVRINILSRPAPAAKPAINMTRTLDPFDAIPRPFCWGLFGIAAFIFLIQIWNYVVS
jgi:hypothetical protein